MPWNPNALTPVEMRRAADAAAVFPSGRAGWWGNANGLMTWDAKRAASALAENPALANYGCPAVAVARSRGDLSVLGLATALNDVATVFIARGDGGYIRLLSNDPGRVARLLRAWADGRAA